jgi:hypothetical protein
MVNAKLRMDDYKKTLHKKAAMIERELLEPIMEY